VFLIIELPDDSFLGSEAMIVVVDELILSEEKLRRKVGKSTKIDLFHRCFYRISGLATQAFG
jgi:hypothetical protein